MTTAHETAVRELKERATELATPLVDQALPRLKDLYGRGARQPSAEITVSPGTTLELFERTDGDTEFADEFYGYICDVVCEQLKSALGCHDISMYAVNRPIRPGAPALVTVTAHAA